MAAIASYQDLCIDAVDPERLGRFWAAVLGRTASTRDDGLVILDGPTERHRIWVNPVPEPVTVKQRVHLDVHAGALQDVLDAGATPLDVDTQRWQVVRDPEGGELCVFERGRVPEERLYEIVVDAHDPVALAAWWAEVLGARTEQDAADSVEAIPGAPFEFLVFQQVPEPKTVKNRIHFDVRTARVEALVEAGASVVRPRDDDIGWTVLADPEGNEFCAFTE